MNAADASDPARGRIRKAIGDYSLCTRGIEPMIRRETARRGGAARPVAGPSTIASAIGVAETRHRNIVESQPTLVERANLYPVRIVSIRGFIVQRGNRRLVGRRALAPGMAAAEASRRNSRSRLDPEMTRRR